MFRVEGSGLRVEYIHGLNILHCDLKEISRQELGVLRLLVVSFRAGGLGFNTCTSCTSCIMHLDNTVRML